jgi:two-component sensor histidine kinase
MIITSNIADDIALAPQQAARLGLIATELVANAIAHAHPTGVVGEIEVRRQRDSGGILLEVADDGIGLPEDFGPSMDCGTGLRVLRAVAEYLGASVRFNSGGCGLNVEVRVGGDASYGK